MSASPVSAAEAPLLLEIGCEEIPARMVQRAAHDLAQGLAGVLDRAGLGHGAHRAWGGVRRLAVRVESVASRQPDREETILGPPAAAAWRDGRATPAATGFAAKHGADAAALIEVTTERGGYAGLRRRVVGSGLGEVLARSLPGVVGAMSFPKTMRWGDGVPRWVRPVHWVVALHGAQPLALELFGVKADRYSAGHRFLSPGRVALAHADEHQAALERACVVVDPASRRERLAAALHAAAQAAGGRVVEDAELLDEVADLVEWPGVVQGAFDARHLELPREILVTTLRHHQKSFCIQDATGRLLPRFLAVANTDRDPAGHVRRGNEWVVGGRLDDARFFWSEDRARALAVQGERLAGVSFHARVGSYAEKARRIEALAREIATALGLDATTVEHCARAARCAKNDLVTGTVGEFPELQGITGGLLLREEGEPEPVWRAVYEHYRPLGPDDAIAESVTGRVVSLADKLDTLARLVAAGERPTGSRDPFGLRRAGNGIVRILLESGWPLPLEWLFDHAEQSQDVLDVLQERMAGVFRERGFSTNEILSVLRPRLHDQEPLKWPLSDIEARLRALTRVRERDDFRSLVKLTERVDTILSKNADLVARLAGAASPSSAGSDPAEEALGSRVAGLEPEMAGDAGRRRYERIIDHLAGLIEPVERFFTECLVINEADSATTLRRWDLLSRLRTLLTRYFDIRELAGEAERRR